MNSRPLGADRGASAVELAIVLPVLLLVLGGIIDFGLAFTTQMAVTQAAREGARMVALNYSAGDVNSRVNAAAGTFAVTTTIVAGCPARGTTITTQASSVASAGRMFSLRCWYCSATMACAAAETRR